MEKINKLKTLRNLSITNLVLLVSSFVLSVVGVVVIFSSFATTPDVGATLGVLLPQIFLSIAIFVIAIVGTVQASTLQKIDENHKNLFVLWITLIILWIVIGLLSLIPIVGSFLGFINIIFGIVVYSLTINKTTKELKEGK